MKTIDPDMSCFGDEDRFFNPYSYSDDGVMRCCCGFELLREDSNTWKCSGGHHRYRVDEQKILLDKNGNTSVFLPKPKTGTN